MYVACYVPGPEPVTVDGRVVRAGAWVVVDTGEDTAAELVAAGELHPYPELVDGAGQPAEALAARDEAARLNQGA